MSIDADECRLFSYCQTSCKFSTKPGKTSSPDSSAGDSSISTSCPWREISTRRVLRLINQPSFTWLFMYSCILSWVSFKLSVGDINSQTKSGAMGGNFCFCSGVSASHLSFFIQETSGERFAPLGSLKQVEESKQIPSLVCRFQIPKSVAISKL